MAPALNDMHGGERIEVVHPLFQEEGGGSIPTSPLQFRVGQISKPLFKQLNRKWHSRLPECGNVFGGICFGAEFAGVLYAVGYWSAPISYHHDDGHSLELRRMAVGPDAPKNTATRFLRVMVLMLRQLRPDVWRLISYQDPAVHAGAIYKAAGWSNEGSHANVGWSYRSGNIEQAPGDKVRWSLKLCERPTTAKDRPSPWSVKRASPQMEAF